MKRLLPTILISLAVLLITACSGRPEPTLRIGVSQCSSDDWRQKMNEEITREMFAHPEAEVEIRSAHDNNERQIADIRYFAENGFDIIIAAPNQADALTPVIEEVYAKGIPVIVFDRDINGTSYTARMTVDNAAIGASAASYARQLIPHGDINVIEIGGLPGSTPADMRRHGFDSIAASTAGINIKAYTPADWLLPKAEKAADSLLRLYPETNLIYAHNDRMAIGASNAARRLGRDSLRIIGIDAAPNIGIKAVADSVITATFLYPTEGHRLIRLALDILNGRPYERELKLPMSPPVDASNADILLLQSEALADETAKIISLKEQVDTYWDRHSAQTILFYAVLAILLLMCGVVFLLVRAFRLHRRYQQELMDKNSQLAEQRDRQTELNRQLTEATQSKLSFFTNVSHDLRTPLTLISEPVDQLAEAKNLTAEQHTLAEVARRNVRILLRLTNQILDFRKYDSGTLTLHLTEAPLPSLIHQWVDAFTPLAQRRHINLSMSIDGSVTVQTMAADTDKLERVIFNLLGNALKFTPAGGSVKLNIAQSDDNLVITVTDSGIGIAAAELNRIFDRFHRVDTISPNGSGIGLWLVKAFVEMHGGTVTVGSTPGKGSIFTVTLPIRHTDQVTPAEAPSGALDLQEFDDTTEPHATAIDPNKPLMLVIDDNADMRRLLEQTLSQHYTVIQAADGAEGLRKAAKHVPDIVVCDLMMPVMDGLECTRRIKEEISTSHIPVLMLTACPLDEQRAQAYRCGADGYLSKPFTADTLTARCESLIANRRRIRDIYGGHMAAPLPSQKPVENNTAADTCQPPQSGPTVVHDIDSDFYARFLAVAEQEMRNPDTGVDTLAGLMGLGRSQFYRKIKALTGQSPVELLRGMRLRHARNLLTTTELTISEIAYDSGFSVPAYFTKCFRDAYGQTPSELRESLSQKK